MQFCFIDAQNTYIAFKHLVISMFLVSHLWNKSKNKDLKTFNELFVNVYLLYYLVTQKHWTHHIMKISFDELHSLFLILYVLCRSKSTRLPTYVPSSRKCAMVFDISIFLVKEDQLSDLSRNGSIDLHSSTWSYMW